MLKSQPNTIYTRIQISKRNNVPNVVCYLLKITYIRVNISCKYFWTQICMFYTHWSIPVSLDEIKIFISIYLFKKSIIPNSVVRIKFHRPMMKVEETFLTRHFCTWWLLFQILFSPEGRNILRTSKQKFGILKTRVLNITHLGFRLAIP